MDLIEPIFQTLENVILIFDRIEYLVIALATQFV